MSVCRCGHLETSHCGNRAPSTACLECSCGQFLEKRQTPVPADVWTDDFKRRCLSAIEAAISYEDGLDGLVGEAILKEAGKWPTLPDGAMK